jgi:hypothetical protein
MKTIACLFIRNEYLEEQDLNVLDQDILTYYDQISSLIVFDISGVNNHYLEKHLSKKWNAEYIYNTDQGEAINWRNALIKTNFMNADYTILLDEGFYFEATTIKNMYNFIEEHKEVPIGIITPRPMYSIAYVNPVADSYRYVKGCKLIGTLINSKLYQQSKGFKLEYFQGYVDYEYCLQVRSMNHVIVYLENEVSRNRNFKLVEKKVLGMKFKMYERQPLYLYYEARNRHYMYDEYINKEPEFIRKDKISFKHEIREIRLSDPLANEKIKMIKAGVRDYQQKKTGKYLH